MMMMLCDWTMLRPFLEHCRMSVCAPNKKEKRPHSHCLQFLISKHNADRNVLLCSFCTLSVWEDFFFSPEWFTRVFFVCVLVPKDKCQEAQQLVDSFFFFLNQLLTLSLVPSSSSFSSFSPTKTNFSHLTPLVLALSCIHICHRMYLYICIFRCTDGLDSVSMLFHYIAYVFQR